MVTDENDFIYDLMHGEGLICVLMWVFGFEVIGFVRIEVFYLV